MIQENLFVAPDFAFNRVIFNLSFIYEKSWAQSPDNPDWPFHIIILEFVYKNFGSKCSTPKLYTPPCSQTQKAGIWCLF